MQQFLSLGYILWFHSFYRQRKWRFRERLWLGKATGLARVGSRSCHCCVAWSPGPWWCACRGFWADFVHLTWTAALVPALWPWLSSMPGVATFRSYKDCQRFNQAKARTEWVQGYEEEIIQSTAALTSPGIRCGTMRSASFPHDCSFPLLIDVLANCDTHPVTCGAFAVWDVPLKCLLHYLT